MEVEDDMKDKKRKLSQLQALAMYIAQVVRNEMDDFHTEHLAEAQMRVLNPIIRNAIYTALYAAEQADQGCEGSRLWIDFHRQWPDYWEPPVLTEDYVEAVAQLAVNGRLASAMTRLLRGQCP
jgi:hypothetical protein